MEIVLHSALTSPRCGACSTKPMPTDACCFFFECNACGVLMQPKPGEFCVIRSYGSTPCPPIQASNPCCSR